VTRAEEFEQLRALLFAIACRILGSVCEGGAEESRPKSINEPKYAALQ